MGVFETAVKKACHPDDHKGARLGDNSGHDVVKHLTDHAAHGTSDHH